jgi:hypothetical protein
METPEWREILKREFGHQEGSFLSMLRGYMEWDKEAFSRLVKAMQECCEATAGDEKVERWLAKGFHYLSWYPRNWTTHPAWADHPDRTYFDACYWRLTDLANWFFDGYISPEKLPLTPI